ncbi:hypothetical protein B8V81_4978 [Paenibacillus pasadenensis]|uniref:Uncharacterized protein n=1 Tax=Paenibacillus pasadenensis TaxID=217090 RepID=A0A2N5N864_9BACL|nr:hypothetical protein [Paenibacillus pasadenensis]PLT46547.1 hypothetical protein B8V81_4978 [Paenibacillus pasadenensis]
MEPTNPTAVAPAPVPAKTPTAVKPAAPMPIKAPTAAMPVAPPEPVMPVAPVAPSQTTIKNTVVVVMEKPEMKHFCDNHKHRYVLAHTKDGWCVDGFIEHYDDEYVCIAVPCGMNEIDPRAFVGGPGSGPGFGPGFGPYPPLYPYPYYPRRRFARAVFPLAALAGLTLLPFL